MTKTEFLDILKESLSGKISASLLQENMAYYNEYIDSQIRMGKSEQAVMESLGDPRLIARTIVQTNGVENVEDASYKEQSSYSDAEPTRALKVRTIPGWLWTIIAIVIIGCVISLIFSVVSFLLPFLLPILVIMFFVKLFRDWLN